MGTFPVNTVVRHVTEGYTGVVVGTTSIQGVFTGNANCAFQYRIKVPDSEKMKIAPFEDLEVVTDPQAALAALGTPTDESGKAGDGRLKNLGYQISDRSFEERVDILEKFAIPKYGVNSVLYELGGFMIARVGNPGRVLQYKHALTQWNRDINWIVNAYGKENAYPRRYREGLKKKLAGMGYAWQDNIK